MQINIGDHTSSHADWIPIPAGYRTMMRWARTKCIWIAANKPRANTYFKSLKHGRSLTEIVNDRNIWINYKIDGVVYGWAETPGPELAMTNRSFREGRWQLLAREHGHSGGAGGGHVRHVQGRPGRCRSPPRTSAVSSAATAAS